MAVPIVGGLLKRRERRRLRRVMRGYRVLRETNQLGKIAAVKDAIANTCLNGCTTGSRKLIFGSGIGAAEMVVRQYLLVRLAAVNLNKALLHALGEPVSGVVHPLPPEWRGVLREHGFAVSEIKSSLLWNSYVALHLFYGVIAIARRILESSSNILRGSGENLGRYAFFHGLSPGNLPRPGSLGRTHDIVSWYLQWPGRVPDLDTIGHTVPTAPAFGADGVSIVPLAGAIRPLADAGPLARYIGWGIAATLAAAMDLVRGRWWHGIILNEASNASMIRRHAPADLARDYLFHNSTWIFRPLWTYEAEKRGSRITYYFYSTNCESFKTPDGYPLQENFWQAMNWPYYLVWDEYQAEFVRRAVGQTANVSVVGPIWFHSGTSEIPSLPQRSVAVFDVEPHRQSRYQSLGMAQEYFVPETANRFLLDIHDVLSECGATMVLKQKRAIGKLLNRSYGAVLDSLGTSDRFVPIDPGTSASRLIESCAAVISMPFTSTALLAREMERPTIYYDPLGAVQKDDRAAHGIAVVSGRDELRTWLQSVLARPGEGGENSGGKPIVGTTNSIDSVAAQPLNMSTTE